MAFIVYDLNQYSSSEYPKIFIPLKLPVMKNVFRIFPLIFLLNCTQSANEKYVNTPDASELIKVDTEFSDYSVKNGMKAAFMKYAGDEAVMLRPNGYPVEGIDAIRETMATRNDSAFVLNWQPLKAFIAKSGELGYTYGIFKLTTKDSLSKGTYITIWRKKEGEWKFVLDAGNEGLGD